MGGTKGVIIISGLSFYEEEGEEGGIRGTQKEKSLFFGVVSQ